MSEATKLRDSFYEQIERYNTDGIYRCPFCGYGYSYACQLISHFIACDYDKTKRFLY